MFRLKQTLLENTPILLLPAIILLGGFLRFYRLGSKGLWLDEAFSVWMGRQSLAGLFSWLITIDQHPPLYYVSLHYWLILGDDAATVRALSALFATLNLPLMYWLGKRLGGKQFGLFATFILALAPFHIRFAQEARMYALLTLNATVALVALSYLLTDPRSVTRRIGSQFRHFYCSWRQSQAAPEQPDDFRIDLNWLTIAAQRRWLSLPELSTDLAWTGFIVFSVLTLLSHNTAIFFPIAVNVGVGLLFIRNNIGRGNSKSGPISHSILEKGSVWAGAQIRITRSQTTGENSQGSTPNAFRFNWLMAQLAIFLLWSPWLAAFTIQALGVDREFWISPPTFATVTWTLSNFLSPFLPGQISWANWIWGLYGLIFLLGIWHLRRRFGWVMLLLALFLTPLIGELLVSLRRPLFYDRTLIWTTIPLYLLLAAGIRALPHRAYIISVLLMIVTINAISLREYYVVFQKEEWDVAAQFVADDIEADDLVLFNATWVQIPFDFYFREHNKTVVERGAPVDLFDRGILEPKMTEADVPRLKSLLRQHDRVWLVYSHNWYTDPTNIVANTLTDALILREKRIFFGLEVHLYASSPD